jgi:phosphatidylglycerol:prolipoprotein diacylglycerol transferase
MLHHPNFDPIAIAIGPLSIHWYGLMYLCAFASAWTLGRYLTKRPGAHITALQMDDLLFYGAMGVIIGGRLGYVFFYGLDQFLANPLWLFKVWTGGMSFHGGLIGVMTATYLFGRKYHIAWGDVLDFAAILTPLGLFFGRMGNFIGQELWGRAADVPWAMVFPKDPLLLPRHPSQLYEALLEGLLLFLILWVFALKPRPRWAIGGLFVFGYGMARFIVEFFREPDAHLGFQLFGWVTRGQELCIPMMLVGLWCFYWAYGRNQKMV